MTNDPIINDRAQLLLKTLIERYIQDGQPVGSRILSRESGMNLSPATVRNVMADLEDMGLVKAPHTSAGRVPTVRGYRLFVDNLLTVRPLRGSLIERFRDELYRIDDPEALIDRASNLLSSMTRMAGLVMLPRPGAVQLRHIEFLPLSDNRVLVILVVNDQQVQNRIIHTERSYTSSELQQAANYLNSEFAGHDLEGIRSQVLKHMEEIRDDMHQIMQLAVQMADEVIQTSQSADYVVHGETNLMSYAEMGDMDRMRQLFEALKTKQDILHILDKSIHAEGMQIFIGEESGYAAFGECSVVTSPYKMQDEVVGVLGVIGPTRMAYDQVIPVVDVTAKLLGSLLTSE
ncbi:heat-inducible transcriptional repressor HrcA [Thiohalophilus thiocyanatoxydans]|uniref:Heat-inducible transcription repressor HrcA n=1 Tax=Thiohalophilus thiocyanatoxydans TaxID=381308 RepID=A0A4V3H4A5_9GAMM|nr:heat-inducible transcriptional repressor HrcA [Thiohalophilus thiocyanatoxydans]TDY02465.1 heat-inducible transcription repressor HrcA [Thiohalophilus thiocyanatoxydans]